MEDIYEVFMVVDINAKGFHPKGVYKQEEITGLENWSLRASKKNSHAFEVYTKKVDRGCCWGLATGIAAFALTLFSLGLALIFSKHVRTLWKEAFSHRQIVQIKVAKDSSPNKKIELTTPAEKTDQVKQNILPHEPAQEKTPSRQFVKNLGTIDLLAPSSPQSKLPELPALTTTQAETRLTLPEKLDQIDNSKDKLLETLEHLPLTHLASLFNNEGDRNQKISRFIEWFSKFSSAYPHRSFKLVQRIVNVCPDLTLETVLAIRHPLEKHCPFLVHLSAAVVLKALHKKNQEETTLMPFIYKECLDVDSDGPSGNDKALFGDLLASNLSEEEIVPCLDAFLCVTKNNPQPSVTAFLKTMLLQNNPAQTEIAFKKFLHHKDAFPHVTKPDSLTASIASGLGKPSHRPQKIASILRSLPGNKESCKEVVETLNHKCLSATLPLYLYTEIFSELQTDLSGLPHPLPYSVPANTPNATKIHMQADPTQIIDWIAPGHLEGTEWAIDIEDEEVINAFKTFLKNGQLESTTWNALDLEQLLALYKLAAQMKTSRFKQECLLEIAILLATSMGELSERAKPLIVKALENDEGAAQKIARALAPPAEHEIVYDEE